MTNTKLLEKKIERSGYKVTSLAQILGLSEQGFKNKVNDKSEFTAPEIEKLKELLQLSINECNAIFFTVKPAETLRKLRGDRSLSEVAEAVGTTKKVLSDYENGYKIPRDEIKIRLANYFHTTVDAIF